MATPICQMGRRASLEPRATHGLLLLGLMAVPSLIRSLNRWPYTQILPVAAYAVLLFSIPALRNSADWLRAGSSTARGKVCALLLAALASLSIYVWASVSHPDLSRFSARIPSGGIAPIIIAGIIFATLNAAIEEIAWRGVILDALASRVSFGSAVMTQAAAFGIGHYSGIPGGIIGIAMASLFGIALGFLRRIDGGLLLCIAAHVCVDATIYTIVVQSVRP